MMLKRKLRALVLVSAVALPATALAQDPATAPTVPALATMDAGTTAEPLPALEGPAELTAPVESTTPEASPAEDAPLPKAETLGEIKTAVVDGNYALAALLALVFITALLRWGADKVGFLSFFQGKLGGYILVFTASTAGMLLTTVGAGGSLTFRVVSEAVVLGFSAVGGWEAYKDIRNRKRSANASGT